MRNGATSSLPLAAAVFAAAVFATSCSTSRPELERFHVDNRVEKGAFPDVPAVMLLDRTELTFTFATEARRPYAALLHTQRIQILDERALERAKVRIPYDDRSRIMHIQARVTKPDGSVVDSPPDRFVELPRYQEGSPVAKLYNDEGYKLTKVSGAEVGDVIELSYLRVFRDPRWVEPIRIGGELPVVRGEIVITHPNVFDVDYRVTKLGRTIATRPVKLPQSVKNEGDDGEGVPGQRLSWVFENEAAIYPEERRPSVEALATQVHVQLKGYMLRNQRYSAYQSWDDVASWYRELTAGTDVPDAAVESAVKASGGKHGSKADKVRRVQRYLQDQVADVPTFLNLAALPKHGAKDLVVGKIGDAKDQASLGLAMLRHMGVDGFPVLVSRLGSFAVVPDLPTPAPFNHVVIAIPAGGAYQFIDPSTPYLPLGRLPGALQGQRGLLVRPDRAELIDLPEDKSEHNKRAFHVDLALSREGLAQGQMRIELFGLDAALARAILHENVDVPARMQAALSSSDGAALAWREVVRVGGQGDDADLPLKLQVVLAPGEVATAKGESLSLHVEKILGRPLPALWREARRMPLVFDHPYEESVRLSLSLPDSLGIGALPTETASAGELLSVHERWAVADGALWLDRKLRLEARDVDTVEYLTLREPVQALWVAQATPLPVVPGGDRGAAYGSDPF